MDALRSFLIKSDALLPGRKKVERTSFFLFSIAGALVVAFLWASFFHIDRVVRVEGRVIPTGHSRPIQHLEGGIVSAIHTSEGSFVHQGDVLLTIDATSVGANLNENKIKLSSQRARAARLKAEADLAPSVVFPDDLANEDVAKAEAKLFQARKTKLESDVRVHRETIRQHQAALNEAENQHANFAKELQVAQRRVQMLEGMVARKAASHIELLDAQSRESRLQTEMQGAENAKPKIRAALASEQAREASIMADFRTEAQNLLVETQADIDRLEQILTAAEDRVNRTEIRAPIDGTINRLGVTSVGAVVKPGESIIELTPASSEILIEARVPPKDRGELRPEIEAKVRVLAYDTSSLGVLKGKLKEISADTMQDSRGNAYYRAKVLIEKLSAAYKDKPVLPGMTITGDLVIGRRTVMNHLLSPFTKFANNMFRDSR